MRESPLHPEYSTRDLHTLFQRHPYRLVHVHCVCPPHIQRQRWEQRLRAGARHPGHWDLARGTASTEFSASSPLPLHGACLTIDTTDLQAGSVAALTVLLRQIRHPAAD